MIKKVGGYVSEMEKFCLKMGRIIWDMKVGGKRCGYCSILALGGVYN